MNALSRAIRVLGSLKCAVVVISLLALSLTVGTIIESAADTPTSQFWVYRSFWFRTLLAFFGINILAVAITRWPWKPKHSAFLLAHLGILILLFGSWVTDKFGIDGNLRISEGETASVVEMDSAAFVMTDERNFQAFPIEWLPSWLPPGLGFRPKTLQPKGIQQKLKIDQFISHADARVTYFSEPLQPRASEKAAVHFKVVGGPMRISQDFWLWEGTPSSQSLQAGPARFALLREGESALSQITQGGAGGGPQLFFKVGKDGALSFTAISSDGKHKSGPIVKAASGQFETLEPGWKGNVQIQVLESIRNAGALSEYYPSRIQVGPQAPSSAIHVVALDEKGEVPKEASASIWLGLGDRALLHLDSGEVQLAYLPKRIVLPFSVKLDQFKIETDQGTFNPAAYSSAVTLLAGPPGKAGSETKSQHLISMNEPLKVAGYTLYQASYEEGEPRPTTSILSVNRDPGRPWKYSGSLLIVLGSILLFVQKFLLTQKKAQPRVEEVVSASPSFSLDLRTNV